MHKSFPGWAPFYGLPGRETKMLRPPDKLRIMGVTLSRSRLLAACRVILGAAPPMILFFKGERIVTTELTPIAPLLTTIMVGLFTTTGGNVVSTYFGLASFLISMVTLSIVCPLTAGYPWIATCLALSISWMSILIWSWVDPSIRSINVIKLSVIFLLMVSFQVTSAKQGWMMIQNLTTFLVIVSASAAAFIWLAPPLCIQIRKESSVFLYNAGVIVDSLILPLKVRQDSEPFPHFVCSHPIAQITDMRQKQMRHLFYITSLLKEATFETAIDSTVVRFGADFFSKLVILNDCVTSIGAYFARGVGSQLDQEQWKVLYPKLDNYSACVRAYIARILGLIESQYSGGRVPICTFQDIQDDMEYHHNELLIAYTQGVKQDEWKIPNTAEVVTTSMDHLMFQILSLTPHLNDLAEIAYSHATLTNEYGILWRIYYYVKACIMPFVLLLVNTVALVRGVALVMSKMVSCLRSKKEPLKDNQSPTPQAQPKDAYKYMKKLHRLLSKPFTLTKPAPFSWKSYVSSGRWRFPVRMIISTVPITLISVAFILYWTPKLQVPWTITSSIIVMVPSLGGTWRRFFHRGFGTVLGAVLGQVTVEVAHLTHPFVCWGPFILLTFTTTYFYGSKYSRYAYFYLVTNLSYSIVLLSAYPFRTHSWELAAYRMLFVLLGALWGSLCSFILPDKSYDKYLTTVRATAKASLKVMEMIHQSLLQNTPPNLEKLKQMSSEITAFQYATVALRDYAEAESFYNKKTVESITYMRYKIRDLCFSARMQIDSSLRGFFDALKPYSSTFIMEADEVVTNAKKEIGYIDAALSGTKPGPFELSTDAIRATYDDFDIKCSEIKKQLKPFDCLQFNSHITSFRLFGVLINDITRGAEHYHWD